MNFISSFCDTEIRSHSARTAGLASCDGAQSAMTIACAWCAIMPDTNCTPAAVYWGCSMSDRARSAGVIDVSPWGRTSPADGTVGVAVRHAALNATSPTPTTTWLGDSIRYVDMRVRERKPQLPPGEYMRVLAAVRRAA